MKTREILEKEYEIIDVKLVKNLETPNKVKIFLSIIMKELKKNEKIINNELKDNNKIELLEKLLKQINRNTQIINEYLKDDNEVQNKALDLVISNYEYFDKMYNITDKNNHQEVLKLAIFSIIYFNNNLSYLEEKRTEIECFYKGFNYNNFEYEDNREVSDEFIKEKIKSLEEDKTQKNNKQYIRK